ncbi:MAG: class I SAM-dependent methyltransferase [Rhodobacteraceae bacterium]|nr:class I SAM-dependent methyltransferase [Paracoccaceae bacterium]
MQAIRRKSSLRRAAASARNRLSRMKWKATSSVDSVFDAGKVLDVGCGGGQRLAPPVIPYGIEISEVLFAAADKHMRERGGYCLHTTGVEGIKEFDANYFDGVLMHSYLEHEVEALPVLSGAHRCLKAGGRVFVRVPNFASLNRLAFGRKWCGFRYPDHVNYFTPRSLRLMARKAGFSMRILNRLRLPVDDNIHALLTKTD